MQDYSTLLFWLLFYLICLGIWHMRKRKREREHLSLGEYLAIRTPYHIHDIQTMIDEIKVISGFDRESKEAECTWVVRYNAMRCVVYATAHALEISDIQSRSIII